MSDYLHDLRIRLYGAIHRRDKLGLTDEIAAEINDLEFLIAHETRRLARKSSRVSSRVSFWRGLLAGRFLSIPV